MQFSTLVAALVLAILASACTFERTVVERPTVIDQPARPTVVVPGPPGPQGPPGPPGEPGRGGSVIVVPDR